MANNIQINEINNYFDYLTEEEQEIYALNAQKMKVLMEKRKHMKMPTTRKGVSASVSPAQRLIDIEKELFFLEVQFKQDLDTPVTWDVNGLTYKPKWAEEEYIDLISAYTLMGVTYMPIEDSTHLPNRIMVMTANQLTSLFEFLNAKVYEYRILYCTERSSLLTEKKRLQAQLNS